jgi:hypothetical protein
MSLRYARHVRVLWTVTASNLCQVLLVYLDQWGNFNEWSLSAVAHDIARLGQHDEAENFRFGQFYSISSSLFCRTG